MKFQRYYQKQLQERKFPLPALRINWADIYHPTDMQRFLYKDLNIL